MSMTIVRGSATTQPTAPRTADGAQFVDQQPKYLPDSVIDNGGSTPSQAPVVNIFGEFARGPRRGPSMLIGDPGLRQHTFLETGYDADVAVDPSGKWIAFSGAREGERTQIYVQPADAAPSVTQLTNTAADNAQPCFSPDGRRIAFASNRSGRWHLYVMDADGRNVTQLTDGASNDMHPSFSPGGSKLVYSSLPANSGSGFGEQWELWTIDLVSRERRMIGYGLFPAWSPAKDREVIAFQKTRARGSRWFSLWTVRLEKGEASAPTEIAVSTNAALVCPSWNPDGSKLAFASIVEPAQMRNGKPQGQQDIWVMDGAESSNRRRLTDGTATNLTPCWAVDNRVYFVSDRSGHECIWSLPASSPGSAKGNEALAERQDGKTGAAPRPTAPPKDKDASSAASDPSEVKP
jgi:TolB protein